MRYGHLEAQEMFETLGRHLGYGVRRTWQPNAPTDGVWLTAGPQGLLADLPAVAVEVIVSESPKAIRGSIATLVEASPALGVIVLHEEEIRGGMIRRGETADAVERHLASLRSYINDHIRRTPQRIELWTFEQLRRRFELATGRYSLLRKSVPAQVAY